MRTPARVMGPETFHPAEPNRRGERAAWLLTLAVIAVAGFAAWRTGRLPPLSMFFAFFFGAAAILISLGNWMDVNTRIEVDEAGLRYRSPVRQVRLGWGEVEEVYAMPAGQGWRVTVSGAGHSFGLRTASELTFAGWGNLAYGFPQGERLVRLILGQAGLAEPVAQDRGWVCRRRA